MADREILLHGPFTNEQIGELLAFIRRCDEANPGAGWGLYIKADDDATIEQMVETLERGLPPRADRRTVIEVLREH